MSKYWKKSIQILKSKIVKWKIERKRVAQWLQICLVQDEIYKETK